MATPYALKLAGLSEKEFNEYYAQSETSSNLAKSISKYCNEIDLNFPGV
jgi:hypothetical protein